MGLGHLYFRLFLEFVLERHIAFQLRWGILLWGILDTLKFYQQTKQTQKDEQFPSLRVGLFADGVYESEVRVSTYAWVPKALPKSFMCTSPKWPALAPSLGEGGIDSSAAWESTRQCNKVETNMHLNELSKRAAWCHGTTESFPCTWARARRAHAPMGPVTTGPCRQLRCSLKWAKQVVNPWNPQNRSYAHQAIQNVKIVINSQ